MWNVPGGICTNSIPKVLVKVFSAPKTGAEEEMMIVTDTKNEIMIETVFDIIVWVRIETSGGCSGTGFSDL